jgi:hypothetical protein
MDKLNKYRQIIHTLIRRHAMYVPQHGNIQTIPICDVEQDNYLLLDVGWDNTGRVHAIAFHLRIEDEKIWIEWDGTEANIAQELLDAGVPREDIVLAFYRPEHRNLVEFSIPEG